MGVDHRGETRESRVRNYSELGASAPQQQDLVVANVCQMRHCLEFRVSTFDLKVVLGTQSPLY
jgi:hypothetical protein